MFFNNNGREDVTMKRAIAIGLVLTLLLSTETFGAAHSGGRCGDSDHGS